MRPGRTAGPLAVAVLAVGGDDPLHELVADDVGAAEADEADVVDRGEDLADDDETGSLVAGRSIWVMSPVTTIFDPKPSRVRNIFICSGLVFWASSRITKASLIVRPRMKASGATSMIAALEVVVDAIGVEHVVERVEEGPQVGIDLRLDVAGQEPEPLAGLDGGPGEDDPADLARSSAATAIATARKVLPVPAGPIPKVTVCSRIEST
jgi:hypothetical protein